MSKLEKNVKTAKRSLDVLNQVFKQGAKVYEFFTNSAELASAVPGVSSFLMGIKALLPDEKHEEFRRCFRELSTKIDHVRGDIKQLGNEVAWQMTMVQYGDDVGRIEKGMEYFCEIGNRSGKEKERFKDNLKSLFDGRKYILSLDKLFNGVIGNDAFNIPIVPKLYEKTAGDRPKISILATRLLQLLCGGMMVTATFEMMVNGDEAANEITQSYVSRYEEAVANVKSVLQDCVTNAKTNMENDISVFFTKGGSNKGLVTAISKFMSVKYNWLENFCLVYNDMRSSYQPYISGDYCSLNQNHKWGVVFYRKKKDVPKYSEKNWKEAHDILDEVCKMPKVVGGDLQYLPPKMGNEMVVARIEAKRIEWSGCVFFTYDSSVFFGKNPDAETSSTFSIKPIDVSSFHASGILLLK